MILIRSRYTGKTILRVKGNTLAGADLSGSFLPTANLCEYNLEHANLSGADLTYVDLSDANLFGADLSRVKLTTADLDGADLSHANLSGADLSWTNLRHATLHGTFFGNAILALTTFAFCNDISKARGLEDVIHKGPSSIDQQTLRQSVKNLPPIFLRGVGYTPDEITALQKLYGGDKVYMNCFISYGGPDEEFALKLKESLDCHGISSFVYALDNTPGVPLQKQVYKQLVERDKVILVCSKLSLPRAGVVEEIIKTVELELASGAEKLLPVRLDGYVFSPELEALEARRVAASEWKPWVKHLRAYNIADFSGWQHPEKYDPALKRLLKGLQP